MAKACPETPLEEVLDATRLLFRKRFEAPGLALADLTGLDFDTLDPRLRQGAVTAWINDLVARSPTLTAEDVRAEIASKSLGDYELECLAEAFCTEGARRHAEAEALRAELAAR